MGINVGSSKVGYAVPIEITNCYRHRAVVDPFGPKSTIASAPVRVDTATATAADVGKARMLLADGSIDVRYFLYFNTAGVLWPA